MKKINSDKSICNAVCVPCQVSEVLVANETVRREVLLDGGEQQIMVKLWDNHSDVPLHAGQKVVFHNVKTNWFKGLISLNSTDESSVEVRYLFYYSPHNSLMFIRFVLLQAYSSLLCDPTFASDSAFVAHRICF